MICKKFKFCTKDSLRAVAAVTQLLDAGGGAIKTAKEKTAFITDGLKAVQEHVTQKRCKEKSGIDELLQGKWVTRHSIYCKRKKQQLKCYSLLSFFQIITAAITKQDDPICIAWATQEDVNKFFGGAFSVADVEVRKLFLFAYGDCPLVLCNDIKNDKEDVSLANYLKRFNAGDAALSRHTLKMSNDTPPNIIVASASSDSSAKTKGRPEGKTSMHFQSQIYWSYWTQELQTRLKLEGKDSTVTETTENIKTWYEAARTRMNALRKENQKTSLDDQAQAKKDAAAAAAGEANNSNPTPVTVPKIFVVDYSMFEGEMKEV